MGASIIFHESPGYYGTVGSGQLGSFSDHFLCNFGRNPVARNLLESAKAVPESRRPVPDPTQISTDPVAGMIDLIN
ncbi:unnamed protein product [Adineta ricciae]|uniref:Uncharacterized protein n=1 Tax=Adineta ricciae TaxID=249248 RepID=A0A815WMY5_ADIRI|nr:unnamed protein product [Adineta ricciae]